MKIISHRGNLNGSSKSSINLENNPEQIDKCINLGFDVEIDIWKINDQLFLGHDSPTYLIDHTWLEERNSKLWIHCKNINALQSLKNTFNCFGHNSDDYVLTSKQYIWVYPDKPLIKGCVAVLPESGDYRLIDLEVCHYICTDLPLKYKEIFN